MRSIKHQFNQREVTAFLVTTLLLIVLFSSTSQAQTSIYVSVSISCTPTAIEVDTYPRTIAVTGTITAEDGSRLNGKTVRLEWLKPGHDWEDSGYSDTADYNGHYSITVDASAGQVDTRWVLRAAFYESGYMPNLSDVVNIYFVDYKAATSLSIYTNTTTLQKNTYQVANISGYLLCCGSGLAYKNVLLSVMGGSYSSWTPFDSISTNSEGFFSRTVGQFILSDLGNYNIKASFAQGNTDPDYLSTENQLTIRVIPRVQQATSLSITCNPAYVENNHVVETSGYLTSNDEPVRSAYVLLLAKGAAATSWTAVGYTSTDYWGYYSTDVYPVGIIDGMCQLKAMTLFTEADAYQNSTATTNIQLATIDTDPVTLTGNSAHIDHSSAGVILDITGPSLTSGSTLTVTSIRYGTAQPEGTGEFTTLGHVFYDVQVLPSSGSFSSDVLVTIQITDDSIDASTVVSYWDGANWVPVSSTFTPSHTISFVLPASELWGTPISLSPMGLVVTPENPIGVLAALIACFCGFAVLRFKKPMHTVCA